MSQLSYQVHVQRIDTSLNMARFYRLAIQPTLFGNLCVVRNWGRIGTRGQERVDLLESEAQAVSLFLEILRTKRRRGYRPAARAANYPK
ncbi:hypothetical protein N182_34925 [Sinorhizobium sp. GL2]|nr:hypothetical protein N182_34925 [Sinorhizobium sp. GL2]